MQQALVVDDHPLVREGVRDLLQRSFPSIEIKTSAGTGAIAEEVCGARWAFIVLDINLPGTNGLDLLKQVKARHPDVPVIVFSLHSERQYEVRALRAGATAYLSKDRSPRDLVEIVKQILMGRQRRKHIAVRPALTDREIQVLALLVKGRRRSEISEQLGISEKTVSTYQGRLIEKLDVRNLMELIRYAVEEGLVDWPAKRPLS
jgi:DNA-binding NarL/FixJ family response regulator